jgi:hypothetical protein
MSPHRSNLPKMKKLFGSAELKMKDCAIGVIFDKELPF